jgi:hypothetical protein
VKIDLVVDNVFVLYEPCNCMRSSPSDWCVALIGAGTTASQTRRLAALRRVHRKRIR